MKRYLIALALSGVVDAISYMVVTPSLVFYVLENGGTKESYGLIMSAFSFASFCTKPVLGMWSDVSGGFKVPFITSLIVAAIGGLVYLLASALPDGRAAVGAILAARLLGGVGAANSALGFAYVARAVPQEEQTKTNSMLSMMRILGMASGPGVNILVSWIHLDIGAWRLDPLNSVGIILIICNLLAVASIFFMLDEPDLPDKEEEAAIDADFRPQLSKQGSSFAASTAEIIKATISLDILVPVLSIFSFNANFQLIETGFAPAAHHALGWGPVATSIALGSISFIIAFNMYAVMQLSSNGVSDPKLLCGGLVLSAVAYLALYFGWTAESSAWEFYFPILGAACSFPFLAAPTRSIFTVAVNSKPPLKGYQGSFQALLSMGASVAGFVAPGLIAAFCLRHPDEVDASADKRELTPWSLFAPILSLVTLVGMAFIGISKKGETGAKAKEEQVDELNADDEKALGEASSLLESSKRRASCTKSKREKRSSMIAVRTSACQCMGLTQTGEENTIA